MIGYFYEMDEVGQFAIARSVTEVSLFPVFALVMTLRPALASRFSAGRIEDCSRILQQTFLYALVFGVLFASIFSVFAVPLFTLVYSDDFLYAGQLMAVFIWVIVVRSVGAILLPSLIAAERTRFYAWLTGVTAGLNVVLNLILIPLYQSWGAVIATILSYTVLLIFGFRQVDRIFKLRFGSNELSMAARTFLAGLIAAGVVWPMLKVFGKGEAGFSLPLIIVLVVLQLLVFTALIHLFRVAKVGQMRAIVSKLGKAND
jgi:O-antigen/teichoic acid export membrane protein